MMTVQMLIKIYVKLIEFAGKNYKLWPKELTNEKNKNSYAP